MVRKLKDSLVLGLIWLSASLSVFLLAGIMLYVFFRGLPVIRWSFLTSVSSAVQGNVGIAGNIVNTLYVTGLTLLFAVPVGIGAAVWLNEYAGPSRWRRLIEFATETLAGIPSIVFGLFGMVFFGTTLGLGYSLLTGALTINLVILPLITRNTQEALRAVPDSYREAAAGMGAARWYMIRTVLLPSAMPGIVTGVLLAIGRIVGESAALLLTAGSGYLLPKAGQGFLDKILASGGTLAVQLYFSMAKARYDAAFGIAAVLLGVIFCLNMLAKILARRWDLTAR